MYTYFKELPSLTLLNAQTKWFHFKEWLFVIRHYYADFSFFRIDFCLLTHYFFKNPFRISKNFLLKRKESDLYTYGETPLKVFAKIAKEVHLKSSDCFYELGSGRGRGCFWMRHFIGCKVVGIEYIPTFVNVAERIVQKFKINKLTFKCENFFESFLTNATVIYFYAICMEESEIKKMIARFEKLPPGIIIITVSFSLKDYDSSTSYLPFKLFQATFDWGEADVFIQKK